jgi:predicted HTH transcriptional regulator
MVLLVNQEIASVCKDMRLIEKYGSGTGKIRDNCKQEGYPEQPKHRNQKYFLTEKGKKSKTEI